MPSLSNNDDGLTAHLSHPFSRVDSNGYSVFTYIIS